MYFAARDCEEVDQGGGWHWAGKYDMNFWDIPLTASTNTQIRIIACVTTCVQADWNSKTPLHCAAAGGFGDIAKLLVESKADLKVWV